MMCVWGVVLVQSYWLVVVSLSPYVVVQVSAPPSEVALGELWLVVAQLCKKI